MREILVHYHVALMSLAVLCFAILIQAILTAVFAFSKKGGQQPGRLTGTPDDFSFRVLRTYSNSAENLPIFAVLVLLAILAGVSAAVLNWLAAIHVVLRLMFWAVYYSKVGAKTPGLRSPIYALSWLVMIILAVMVIVALAH